jgi:hypothetical protein
MGYSPVRSYRLAASDNAGIREMPSTKKGGNRESGAKPLNLLQESINTNFGMFGHLLLLEAKSDFSRR